MILYTKPLKTRLKETQNPIMDFIESTPENFQNPISSKDVLFVRYIGISGTVENYIQDIQKIEQCLSSSLSNISYLRLSKLNNVSNLIDIDRLILTAEPWLNNINIPEQTAQTLHSISLCTSLGDESLELTKKLTFKYILSLYCEINPTSNTSMLKNFCIKFLYWIETYLPLIFKSNQPFIFPKIVFVGDIKQHELLFLNFLSKLGCDILYMNPCEDIIKNHPESANFSSLYMCETLNSTQITIPDFVPMNKNKEVSPQLSPSLSSFSSITINESTASTLNPTPKVELNYERLARLSTSVVMIKVCDESNNFLCSGSGVVIHSQGYILTNLHVVDKGPRFSIIFENDSQEYMSYTIIKYHQDHDLAVIKVDRHCIPITVYTNNDLVRGQKIVTIGSPLGLFNSISEGIISAFRDFSNTSLIQFTAPISNGSSGGALLDMAGNLTGLITAGFDGGQNLNLAIPSDIIYFFAKNFIEKT